MRITDVMTVKVKINEFDDASKLSTIAFKLRQLADEIESAKQYVTAGAVNDEKGFISFSMYRVN